MFFDQEEGMKKPSTVSIIFMLLLAIGLACWIAPVLAVQTDKGQPLTKKATTTQAQSASPKSSSSTPLSLVVQQIDANDGQVTIIISTTGQLTGDVYETAVLRVSAPGMLQPQTFPLAQVDPGRSLSKTGGRVSFNTKIPLKTAGVVTATLARGQWSASKQTPVTPRMVHLPEQAKMAGSMHTMRAAPLRPDPPSTPTIDIRYPRAGETFYTDPLNVQWSIGGYGLEADTEYNESIILLKNGVELQRVGPFNFAGRSRSQNLSMFGRLNGADYQAKVELYRLASGTTDRTLIHSQSTGYFSFINTIITETEAQPVIMRAPSGQHGESYAAGSSIHLLWGCVSTWRTGDHPVRLSLVRDSTEGGGEWLIRESVNCATFELDWTIPVTVPPGSGYRILVQSLEGSAASATAYPFSIGAAR